MFPDFNININQVWNGEEFELGDTLINAQGNEVILNDYLIVMSGFSLIAENQGYTIIETVELTCLTSSVVPYFVPNDVVVITPNSTAISLGEFNSSDIYNQLDFLIGVNECFHNASLDELDNISTVSQIETLYTDGEGFTNMYFTFADSTRLDFVGVPDVIQLNKAVNASSSLGQDLAIDMTIDLGVWLEDIDLSESTLVSKSKIGLKVEQAISIE